MIEKFRDINPEGRSCPPRIDLRIEKLHTWQRTLQERQVQCHAHIPGRDKALNFIASVQGENFRLRILETAVEIFANSSVPICSPVKIQNAYWWTKGRTNIRIGRSAASISKLGGRWRREISRELRTELWTLESQPSKLYSFLQHYDVSDETFCV